MSRRISAGTAGLGLIVFAVVALLVEGVADRASASEDAAAPPAAVEPDARIRELVASIRADQHRVIELIGTPRPQGAPNISEDAEIRELAARLPRLQAELRSLGGERALRDAPSLLP